MNAENDSNRFESKRPVSGQVGWFYYERTGMAAERLVRLSGLAVGDVYLAVTGAAADEQTAPVGRVLDETNVTDGAVVHG